MIINVCDGETVVVCDPPLDQDDVATEIVRYTAGGHARLRAHREDRVIEVCADRSGRIFCRVYDENGNETKNLDVMFDAL